jgi:hypothetical protein
MRSKPEIFALQAAECRRKAAVATDRTGKVRLANESRLARMSLWNTRCSAGALSLCCEDLEPSKAWQVLDMAPRGRIGCFQNHDPTFHRLAFQRWSSDRAKQISKKREHCPVPFHSGIPSRELRFLASIES